MQQAIFAAPDAPGLADPVLDSQAIFRAILRAFSRPGIPADFSAATAVAAPLPAGVALACLALCDQDTPVWFGPGLDAKPVCDWARFHTGVPLSAGPEQAAFAFLDGMEALPALQKFSMGTDLAPEAGATLIISTPRQLGQREMILSGPGLPAPASVLLPALPPLFWKQREAMQAGYPRGLDLLFCSETAFTGLPRTTAISRTPGV